MNDKRTFLAGDHVCHRPSGEQWNLACDEDPSGPSVYPSGWPETRAAASDCDLVEPASQEERMTTLRRVADGGGDGYRSALASSQLAELDNDYALELAEAELARLATSAHRIATRVALLRARHGRDLVRRRPHGSLLDAMDTELCAVSRELAGS